MANINLKYTGNKKTSVKQRIVWKLKDLTEKIVWNKIAQLVPVTIRTNTLRSQLISDTEAC